MSLTLPARQMWISLEPRQRRLHIRTEFYYFVPCVRPSYPSLRPHLGLRELAVHMRRVCSERCTPQLGSNEGTGFPKSSISTTCTMGLEVESVGRTQSKRKLRLMGLHGFRTSGDILRRQLSKWEPSLHELFDVDYVDAPLPCVGKSDVEGVFDGPYYEWFRTNKDFTEFYHLDEMLTYITDYMKLHGPYDGFLGFSQGAVISGCLAGLQEKGLALQDVPPIRLVVLISTAQLRASHLKQVYEGATIKCPTLAFLGEKDFLRPYGAEALKSFENKVIINHRFAHTVPRLDEAQTATVAQFLRSQLAVIDAKDEIEDVTTNTLASAHSEDIHVTA